MIKKRNKKSKRKNRTAPIRKTSKHLEKSVTRCWAFVSVGVSTAQRIPLSVLARNPHKSLCTRSLSRPEENEGRKVPEKTKRDSQQMRVGQRGDQSTVRSQEKEAEQISWQNREGSRTELSTEVGGSWWSKKAAARTYELKAGLTNVRRWVSIP